MRAIEIGLILAALVGLAVCIAGCEPQSLRQYGEAGYTLYTQWIAQSQAWPEDVPRLTPEQVRAFAQASWAEHEQAVAWVRAHIEATRKEDD